MGDLWVPGSAQSPGVAGDGLQTHIDLYDSDLLVIEQILIRLQRHTNTQMNLQGFVDEARERFGEAGFKVAVAIYEVQSPGPLPVGSYVPEITIQDRLTREEFDRDKMTWEVQSDILEIDPTPGAMQLDGTIKSPSKATSFSTPRE